MERFNKGDIVQLKSGGPKMTVDEPQTETGNVLCTWFAGNKLQQGYFDPETIKKLREEGSGEETS